MGVKAYYYSSILHLVDYFSPQFGNGSISNVHLWNYPLGKSDMQKWTNVTFGTAPLSGNIYNDSVVMDIYGEVMVVCVNDEWLKREFLTVSTEIFTINPTEKITERPVETSTDGSTGIGRSTETPTEINRNASTILYIENTTEMPTRTTTEKSFETSTERATETPSEIPTKVQSGGGGTNSEEHSSISTKIATTAEPTVGTHRSATQKETTRMPVEPPVDLPELWMVPWVIGGTAAVALLSVMVVVATRCVRRCIKLRRLQDRRGVHIVTIRDVGQPVPSANSIVAYQMPVYYQNDEPT